MSVYIALNAFLSPLVSGKAYADVVPNGTQAPYLKFRQIGGRIRNTNCKTTSARRGEVPLIQIDVHGKNAVERDAILQAIDAAINANLQNNATPRLQTFDHPELDYDENTKTYWAMLTYQVTAF